MKVYAIPEPQRQTVVVYVELGDGSMGSRWFAQQDGDPVDVKAGEEPPLYMRLDLRIAEEIGRALAPRPEVTERHLDDAIVVRDRLLAMVERASYPPQIVTGPGA